MLVHHTLMMINRQCKCVINFSGVDELVAASSVASAAAAAISAVEMDKNALGMAANQMYCPTDVEMNFHVIRT